MLSIQFSRKGKNNLLINKFAKVLLIKKTALPSGKAVC